MIYLFENDKTDNRAAAHELLRRGLYEEYGIDGAAPFVYGGHGKPYLADRPDIFFNLSHCRAGAACVISGSECGIDMQDVRNSRAAARRVCTEEELALLAASPDPDRLFTKLWAIKEAYVKRRGGSMLEGIVNTSEITREAFLYEGKDYFLCCFGYEGGVIKCVPQPI